MISEIKTILTALDNYMFSHVHPYINEANTAFMLDISFFASHYFLLPAHILAAACFIWIKKDRWSAIKVVAIGIGNLLLMLSLPAHNWYRLIGWMALGLMAYFLYGRRHSRVSHPAA